MASIFPDTPVPVYPFDLEMEFKTLISPYDSGDEQRRSKWQFPKYNFNLTFDNLSLSDVRTLWEFYQTCKGAYDTVYYFLPWTDAYMGLYMGTGTGAVGTYDFPGKSTSGHRVYLDGVLQVQGVNYWVLTGGGQGNADRAIFQAYVPAGVVVTADMAGFLRVKCRFKNDKLSKRLFEVLLFTVGIEMKGLGGA